MTRIAAVSGLFAGVLIAGGLCPSEARACGTAACSLASRSDEARLRRGSLQVDLSWRLVDQDRRLDGHGPVVVAGVAEPEVLRPRVDYDNRRLTPGYHHDWGLVGSFVQADLAYGLTSRIGMHLSLPVATRRTVDHLFFPGSLAANHGSDGTAISRQDLTTSGVGDAQVSVSYAVSRRARVALSVKLPNGEYRLPDETGSTADPMVQPGSGAWAYGATAAVTGSLRTTPWSATLTYQRQGTNPLGYRLGDELFLSGRSSHALSGRVAATFLAKMQYSARSEFLGLQSLSTGAVAFLVAPGLRLRLAGLVMTASLQVPAFQHVNESQLGVRTVFQAGLSRTF